LGSEVHLIDLADRPLSREEPAAGELIRERFEREGIQLRLGARVVRVEQTETGKRLCIDGAAGEPFVEGDEVLVAVGRAPNVQGLGLEAAGVKFDERGVQVDDRLRTSNRRIFAAGDVIGSYQFTHAADAMARACIQNALFFGRKRLSRLVVPRTTYTDPEVAQVGLTAAEAEQQGIALDTYREELANVDRAILDGDDEGFALVHCRQGSGRIVGATIVAPHAGEMIGEITLLMTNRLSLSALASTIHCYPTQVEVLKRIADQYSRSRLTPRLASLFEWWLARLR
jgi:pyruvate/2-oxoglutarate dehydrogenase complex dihydrolipoamide dehydrogenase (E3) component